MTPRWWSQMYAPSGGSASDGILKQLGLPTLDHLTVMLRESAQNAWDARSDDDGRVRLRYEVGSLGADRSRAFRDVLLPFDTPDTHVASLAEHLNPDGRVLVISDRGTTGLRGPIRGNLAAGDAVADFVNFVRNVGEPRDRELGGGTFGFGKGALFRVSQPGVLLVDSVCNTEEGRERRLIGMALGHAHDHAGYRYTGRHWWGIVHDDVPDPLIGADASDLARQIGLADFGDETGTDIYVLGADFGENGDGTSRTALDAAEHLSSAAAWNLWPKLLGRTGAEQVLNLSVQADGVDVEIPDPSTRGSLRHFVEALTLLDQGSGVTHSRATAPTHIGDFTAVVGATTPYSDRALDIARPFDGRARHCARMRSVELVVDYFPGPDHSDPLLEYGAVYRASEEADEYFAEAEPPTHHDWVTIGLVGTAKGVVTGARRFIADQLTRISEPPEAAPSGGTTAPLGALSSALASALPSAIGDGAGGRSPVGGTGSGGRQGGSTKLVELRGDPRLLVRDSELVVVQDVSFQPAEELIVARASAAVGVEGASERLAPDGAPVPTIQGWEHESQDGTAERRPGAELTIAPEDPRDWRVVAVPASDSSTILTVTQVREQD